MKESNEIKKFLLKLSTLKGDSTYQALFISQYDTYYVYINDNDDFILSTRSTRPKGYHIAFFSDKEHAEIILNKLMDNNLDILVSSEYIEI